MENLEKLKRKFHNGFKLSGFSIRREFCTQIIEKFHDAQINLNDTDEFEKAIKKICENLEKQCISGRSIEQEHIDQAIEVCLHSGYDRNETIFNVINAFDFPRFQYNTDRKIYLPDPQKKSTLLADAQTKTKLFLDRYSRIFQRTKRLMGKGKKLKNENEQLNLQTVDYLLTLSEITLENTVILGSLLLAPNGKFYLEDSTGIVQLDLTHTKYHIGFYVENIIVLVNGYYEDKILYVSSMVHPPGEIAIESKPTFGNLNYFGGNSNVPLKNSEKLQKHLLENHEKMFVFLSDVWLDHPLIFEKLEKLFSQMEEFMPPIAFILMGNFLSESHGNTTITDLCRLFRELGQLISKYKRLLNESEFIFIPGMFDPCLPYIVPRIELPKCITNEIHKYIPKAIFTTNPCRIQYCTKEIVLFRGNILAKFLQGSLHKPAKEDIPKAVTRTIISQGHLTPFSLNALTVHWDYDYCMALYPLPDLVVIGDRFEAYTDNYKNCIVTNPGQFCRGDFSFKMYYPASGSLDEAVIDCCVDVRNETE